MVTPPLVRHRSPPVFLSSCPEGSAARLPDDEEDAIDAELHDIEFDEGDYAAGEATESDVAADVLPPLPAAVLLNAFDVWSSRATRGIDVLASRQAQKQQTLGPYTGYDVSIMAGTSVGDSVPEVCFVYWQSVPELLGRKIELDDEQRAKWPTSAVYPLHSFAGWTTVTPITGCLVKKSKEHRTAMPPAMLTLKDMWQSALNTSSGEVLATSPCWACELDVDADPVFECALCICAWHPRCVHAVAASRHAAISARRKPAPVRGGADLLPGEIAQTLCPLCAAWLHRDFSPAYTLAT